MKTFKLAAIALALTALVGCSTVRPLSEIGIKDVPKNTETIVKEINTLPADRKSVV